MRDEFKNNLWSKRFLPHYHAADKFQMITYRLADSIPAEVLQKVEQKIKAENENSLGAPRSDAGKELEIKRRLLIEKILDRGLGSCLLSEKDVAAKQIEAWNFFDGKKYDLIAYVVMPNHVHLLIKTYEEFSIGRLVWSWKKYVSSYVFSNESYRDDYLKSYRQFLSLKPLPASERGAPGIQLWQREYWDRFIRDEKHFRKSIDYIHMNPVKAGLAASQYDWNSSSALLFKDVIK